MKNNRLLLVLIAVALGVIIFGILVAILANKYLTNISEKQTHLVNCVGKKAKDINLTIKNDKLSQTNIKATTCDTLTIKNLDATERQITFGTYQKHANYDGIKEKKLAKGQSFTITLDKAGQYKFHDHNDDQIEGQLIIE